MPSVLYDGGKPDLFPLDMDCPALPNTNGGAARALRPWMNPAFSTDVAVSGTRPRPSDVPLVTLFLGGSTPLEAPCWPPAGKSRWSCRSRRRPSAGYISEDVPAMAPCMEEPARLPSRTLPPFIFEGGCQGIARRADRNAQRPTRLWRRGGGMSPITMALLGRPAYKAVKGFGGANQRTETQVGARGGTSQAGRRARRPPPRRAGRCGSWRGSGRSRRDLEQRVGRSA